MIDMNNEELLSLVEATKTIPPIDGKRPHASSLWRWASKGVRGVKLEHLRVGRRVVTTREALQRFFQAVAEAPKPERPPLRRKLRGRTEKQRDRDIERAKENLRARGFDV
jgi:hypothetical protein